MGYYIDPQDMSKEQFLEEEGHPISQRSLAKYTFDQDTLPICLIINPGHSAAGIAYNARELKRFRDGYNGRPFQWYLVPRDKLNPYLPAGLR